jgi:hypothetical protein
MCQERTNILKFSLHNLGFYHIKFLINLILSLGINELEIKAIFYKIVILVQFLVDLIKKWIKIVLSGVERVLLDKVFKIILNCFKLSREIVLFFTELVLENRELKL